MFLLVVLQLRCIIPDTSSGEFIYTITHFKRNKISHLPAVDCKYFSVDIIPSRERFQKETKTRLSVITVKLFKFDDNFVCVE